jgi:hypothetical protein
LIRFSRLRFQDLENTIFQAAVLSLLGFCSFTAARFHPAPLPIRNPFSSGCLPYQDQRPLTGPSNLRSRNWGDVGGNREGFPGEAGSIDPANAIHPLRAAPPFQAGPCVAQKRYGRRQITGRRVRRWAACGPVIKAADGDHASWASRNWTRPAWWENRERIKNFQHDLRSTGKGSAGPGPDLSSPWMTTARRAPTSS